MTYVNGIIPEIKELVVEELAPPPPDMTLREMVKEAVKAGKFETFEGCSYIRETFQTTIKANTFLSYRAKLTNTGRERWGKARKKKTRKQRAPRQKKETQEVVAGPTETHAFYQSVGELVRTFGADAVRKAVDLFDV